MVDEIAAAQSVAGVKRLREARAQVVGHPLLPDLERAAGAKATPDPARGRTALCRALGIHHAA